MKKIIYKGKVIEPYESFYYNTTEAFFHGTYGGGISRCVKCDDSLAVLVMEESKTICLNSKVNGKQPSIQDRIYDIDGCSTAITTCFLPNIAEPQIGAMRGRNPNNPSERGKSEGNYKQ